MFVSKVRQDGVFDGLVEFPDGTTAIPSGHSFSLPPEIPDGFYAIMMSGWKLIEGNKPVYPPIPTRSENLWKFEGELNKIAQTRLDDFAKTKGYQNIAVACTYAASSIEEFKKDAEDCVRLRDETWSAVFKIIKDLRDDETSIIPTHYEKFEAMLPSLDWS